MRLISGIYLGIIPLLSHAQLLSDVQMQKLAERYMNAREDFERGGSSAFLNNFKLTPKDSQFVVHSLKGLPKLPKAKFENGELVIYSKIYNNIRIKAVNQESEGLIFRINDQKMLMAFGNDLEMICYKLRDFGTKRISFLDLIISEAHAAYVAAAPLTVLAAGVIVRYILNSNISNNPEGPKFSH